jgi:hypothetical protein
MTTYTTNNSKTVQNSSIIKIGSLTNILLNYAKMKRATYFTLEGFNKMRNNAHKPSVALRSLNSLLRGGYVVECGPNQYRITQMGIHKLFEMGLKRRRQEDAMFNSGASQPEAEWPQDE